MGRYPEFQSLKQIHWCIIVHILNREKFEYQNKGSYLWISELKVIRFLKISIHIVLFL